MITDLTKGKIVTHLRRIAIPASIGFFFNTMYNVVDTFWAGRLSTNALAALALSFPAFFIIMAFAFGFQSGSTALISNALGAKKKKEAKHLLVQSLGFGLFVSTSLTIFGYLVSPAIFKSLGADGNLLEIGLDYIYIIFAGNYFMILSQILNSALNASGDTKSFRNSLIAGFFANLILDPLLMFGWWIFPELGIKGIALATVMIQGAGMVYMFYRTNRADFIPKNWLKDLKPKKSTWLEITRQGLPASLNMLTVALGVFVINFFIKDYGKEAIAAYGIAIRIEQIALLPTIGLNMAVLAMVGQNNGAKKFDRIRETTKLAIKYGSIIMLILMPIIYIFASPLNGLFTDDQKVIDFGTEYLRITIFVSIGYVIMFVMTSALQGMKRPTFALWIGLYRQIAGAFVIFYLLTKILDFGLNGIWWGIAFLVWSSVLVALWYERRVFNEMANN